MKFEIPKPMKIEHDELHADLVNATEAGGQTGEAAKAVAKVLRRSLSEPVIFGFLDIRPDRERPQPER